MYFRIKYENLQLKYENFRIKYENFRIKYENLQLKYDFLSVNPHQQRIYVLLNLLKYLNILKILNKNFDFLKIKKLKSRR